MKIYSKIPIFFCDKKGRYGYFSIFAELNFFRQPFKRFNCLFIKFIKVYIIEILLFKLNIILIRPKNKAEYFNLLIIILSE